MTIDHAPARAQTFADLGVPATLVSALSDAGITTPFPIQSATLPDSLAGRDVLGRGRTGSGKTYAFVLPLLARLASSPSKRRPNRPRALVLAPTRELASQIDAAMAPLARRLGLRTLTVYGGVRPAPQIRGLRDGVDVVVARSPFSTRRTTWLTSASSPSYVACWTGPRRASGCCSPPRWTAASTCS
jgi:superfamily II DNA/RNA helicase